MEDLFKELIQGSGQQAPEESAAGDPLSGILQGLLGGGSLEGAGMPSAPSSGLEGGGGLDLGGLLQAIMGGGGLGSGMGEAQGISSGAGLGGGGLGGILGAVLGGGGSSSTADPFASAIAGLLSKKLGLPPQIAQAVVVFVLGKLLKGRTQAGASTPAGSGAQGLSLDGLLGRMNSGATVRKTDIRATGMAQELAAFTGLDRRTAEASLQEVLNALGGQVGSAASARAPRRPRQSGLDGMLDDWPK